MLLTFKAFGDINADNYYTNCAVNASTVNVGSIREPPLTVSSGGSITTPSLTVSNDIAVNRYFYNSNARLFQASSIKLTNPLNTSIIRFNSTGISLAADVDMHSTSSSV